MELARGITPGSYYLYQFLQLGTKKRDPECTELRQEKGIQRIWGSLVPKQGDINIEVLALPLPLITEAEWVDQGVLLDTCFYNCSHPNNPHVLFILPLR